jgi:hypothetical protein
MLKKIAIVFVFIFVAVSLGSCRSKKKSCNYGKINVQEKTQEVQQYVVVACVD